MAEEIDKKTEQFFLGGATEPVALEFTISAHSNLDDILRILSENGLKVTPNLSGRDAEKIFIDKETVITPPLRPQDVIPIYEILETALDEAGCNVDSTPHIIDLKSIAPGNDARLYNQQDEIRNKYRQETEASGLCFEDYMIEQAKKSDKMIKFNWPNEGEIPPEIYQGFAAEDLIFNGSTIPDPYITATQLVRRNVRMASSNFVDAVRYSHCVNKDICGYALKSDTQQYGFCHIYKAAQNQCYYDGIGIEFKQPPYYRGCDYEETMVNRFQNPCVCEYLVLREDLGNRKYIYSLFPIPQDNEQWQDFKTLSQRTNKSNYTTIYNLLSSQKDNPHAVIPLINEAYDENGIKKEFYEKRLEKLEQELAKIKETAQNNVQDIAKMEQTASNIIEDEKKSLEDKKQELNELEKKSKEKKKQNDELINYVKAYNLAGKLKFLEKEIRDIGYICSSTPTISVVLWLENMKKIEDNKKRLLNNQYNDMCDNIKNHQEFSAEINLKKFSADSRERLMNSIKNNVRNFLSPENLKNAMRLYTAFETTDERILMFKHIFDLTSNKRNKQTVAKVLKEMKTCNKFQLYPELKEVLKPKNLFINHYKKAQKIININKETDRQL